MVLPDGLLTIHWGGDAEDEAGDVPAGIPDFWLAVLQSHKELSETVSLMLTYSAVQP